MSVLLLRLAGPMQSWGEAARFNQRTSSSAPTKSGILGLVAAAEGRRRTDPVEDLVQLKFGVRTDQPGSILRDFQTTIDQSGKSKPLTYRSYLTDAVFVAGLEGPRDVLERLEAAIQKPKFPLFLGRRSCPPDTPLSMGVREGNLLPVLESTEWQAADWYKKRRNRAGGYQARILCDVIEGQENASSFAMRDVPISWDPTHRQYAWRNVVESSVELLDARQLVGHDPFELGEG